MSITTNLVTTISLCQIICFTYFLLPMKKTFKYKFLSIIKSRHSKPFYKILMALYTMIFVFFLDSFYKGSSLEDVLLKYYHRSNSYLTGFTLFNALILYRFIQVYNEFMEEEEKTNILKKQCINQKDFVDKILKELEEKKAENKELKDEIKRARVLTKQNKNNEKAYFDLLDKYNELKEITEPKKKK